MLPCFDLLHQLASTEGAYTTEPCLLRLPPSSGHLLHLLPTSRASLFLLALALFPVVFQLPEVPLPLEAHSGCCCLLPTSFSFTIHRMLPTSRASLFLLALALLPVASLLRFFLLPSDLPIFRSSDLLILLHPAGFYMREHISLPASGKWRGAAEADLLSL